MDGTITPPLTPIHQYMSPLDVSPTNSYRAHPRRRNTGSSFSSSHDRHSPLSVRSRHRFSNASQYSLDDATSQKGEGTGGMGNLADELDQLDDEEEYGDEMTVDELTREQEMQQSPVDRDSGIDVSYSSRRNSPLVRNFSKPFCAQMQAEKAPEAQEEQEERLSPELEEAMNNIARMTSYTSTSEDPLIPRTVALLQDLGNQSGLEVRTQRLCTSTNSLSSHLTTQVKALQTLSTALYSPFSTSSFAPVLDTDTIEEALSLITLLLESLPQPDSEALQGLQKLSWETRNVISTLGQLTDTLQMGRVSSQTASRHLRTTQTMVAELRRERERAEEARTELKTSGWNEKIGERWCAGQCREILGGFEEVCEGLRRGIEEGGAVGAA